MEYSSTKKVRLPGISTVLLEHDDDHSSHDSHDYVDEITPRKTASNAAQFQTPVAKSFHDRPSSARRKPKRATLSPSSNQIIHATAEALAANPVEGATIGQVIIDKLDDFGESVWNRWAAFGGRASRGASETSGARVGDEDDDGDSNDDDDGQHESRSTVKYKAGYEGTGDNQYDDVNDSATHSLNNTHVQSQNIIASPPSPPEHHASPNTTQSTEESFYIGLGEEGFCPSTSIHDSDISESGSDEEEAMLTEDEEETEEGDAVNMSILTEYVEEESRGGTACQADERASTSSSWKDEKKEESDEIESRNRMAITSHLKTKESSNTSHHRTPSIPSPLSPCRPAPSPETPAPHPQSDKDDHSLESKDYVSSSLKRYLSLQEDKLSSLLSSIEGLTATPARIQSAVLDDFSREEDLDSAVSLTGFMTPLRSRLERVDLSGGEDRSEEVYQGRHSPVGLDEGKALNGYYSSQEEYDSKLEPKETRRMGELLLYSPPGLSNADDPPIKASVLKTTFDAVQLSHEESSMLIQEEAEHRGGMLLHSPPGLLDEKLSLRASGLEKALNACDSSQEQTNSQWMHDEADHRGGMLLHSPPSHYASSMALSRFENAGSSSMTEEELKGDKSTVAVPQSPLIQKNNMYPRKDDLQTPSVDVHASPFASPLEIAAAEFSTKSTEVMAYLQKDMQTESKANATKYCLDISKPNQYAQGIQGHLEQSVPSSLLSVMAPSVNLHPQISNKSNALSDESDDIPTSLLEMFQNAESILEKELASPVLKRTRTRTDLADHDTFCEDYIKPPSDFKQPAEDSSTLRMINDTANLNHTYAFEGTGISLDSLKGTFSIVESQLESAESSIDRGINPHRNDNLDDDDDTTFDTANFSLGQLAAAVDDFFDARDVADVVQSKGEKDVTECAVGAVEFKSSFADTKVDSSKSICERREAAVECQDDVPMMTNDILRMNSIDGRQSCAKLIAGCDEYEEKLNESKFVTKSLSPYLPENGSHKAVLAVDEHVDITPTLDRVGDYIKRMTMRDQRASSNYEESISSDASRDANYRKKNGLHGFEKSIDSPANFSFTISAPDQDSLKEVFSGIYAVDECLARNDLTTPRACNASTLEPSTLNNTKERMDSTKDFMLDKMVRTESPAKNKTAITHPKCSATNLESSTGLDDIDESMFMPNISMDVTVSNSPIPAAVEQPLQTMPEGDEDSVALSDEEFFPNRDLSRKALSKVATSCSTEEKVPATVSTAAEVPTRARSLSLGGSDLNVIVKEHSSKANSRTSVPSRASRLSHPASKARGSYSPISKSFSQATNSFQPPELKGKAHAQHQPNLSAATAVVRVRQCNRKEAPPSGSPPSNVKPARKRTKLSTITNTNTADSMNTTAESSTKPAKTSPKSVESVLSVSTSTTNKNHVPRAGSGDVGISRRTESISLIARSKTVNTKKELKAVVVSPRTSSIRRSLVAVARNQRQSNIPKPRSSPRDSLHSSERLEQLAKPRSVVQKETPQSPTKTVTKKKLAAAKPPSFLSRAKKSRVKSTEEIEAEQMSKIYRFKASKIKGSSTEVRSRYSTPRASTPIQTRSDQSNPKPFISLKSAIDNYNFREPAAMATPVNLKRLSESTPSFLEREMSKPPKHNVPTLAESIKSYDFRATPVASTPINSKTRPPSFLNRPVAIQIPKSSEELELEECKNKFKACPLPLSSTSKIRPPSRPREGRSLTTPRPPKLHTSMRSGLLKTPVPSQDEIELSKQFHARPLPVSLYGSRFATGTPIRHYRKTPQPSTDDVELRKEFHALPLPAEIYGKTIENDGTPFHIRAEYQYERAQERKRQLIEEEMEELRRSRERKATPLPKTNWEAQPIIIEKSQVELVQPRPPRLSLDVRSRNRKQFDNYVHQVQEAEAAAQAAKLAAEAEAEEAEIRRKRSLSIEEGGFCFRARPICIKYE